MDLVNKQKCCSDIESLPFGTKPKVSGNNQTNINLPLWL